MATSTDTDALLVALADLIGMNVEMRADFLAHQTPAMRDGFWMELAEAKTRLGI
ncbi:hypothetical protein [Nonomuraea sp. LPB2021202275-12-8]|uniref:hypothetical protein n=1 Tax=Nonomuraea sp. LPB2021202275-12-8 TaxID=3120159 RepID=UPI00300CBDB8